MPVPTSWQFLTLTTTHTSTPDLPRTRYEKWRSRLVGLLHPHAPQIFSTPVQPDGERLKRMARMVLATPLVAWCTHPYSGTAYSYPALDMTGSTQVDEGRLHPVIDRYFEGLGAAAEALEYLQHGHARGKLVVRIAASVK